MGRTNLINLGKPKYLALCDVDGDTPAKRSIALMPDIQRLRLGSRT